MTIPSDNSDMLSIQLSTGCDDQNYAIDSVDILQPNFRHRLTFSKNNDVGSVLSPWFAEYVGKILQKIDRGSMVFSDLDAVVDLPGLVLGRLRMLVHTGKNLARQVIIRFTYFIGGVQSVFKAETHFLPPEITAQDSLDVAALRDICVPVFDIVSGAVVDVLDDTVPRRAAPNQIASYSDVESDLLFYLALLKRFICATNSANTRPPDESVLALSATAS